MSIFKKEDRVFDINYSWGTVSESDRDVAWPIQVNFDSGRIINYKLDGSLDNGLAQTLSFTPYDLIKGGFSQERPKPEIEKGTVIWVKDKHSVAWSYGKFAKFDEDKVWIEAINRQCSTIPYDEYSLENPLI